MEPLKISKLNDVISHFESWRATRVGKSRIPAHLWQEAIDLYPSYTISEITRPLRLGHSDFRKKVSQIEQNIAPTDFVRIDRSSARTDNSTSHQLTKDNQTTTIELEKGDGSRIRIQREMNDQALITIIKGYFGDVPCYS